MNENKVEIPKIKPKITRRESYEIINSIIVRCIFILEAICLLFFIVCIINNKYFLFLLFVLVVIVFDGFYVAIKRKGKEFKWFSISVGAFSFIYMVSVWSLVSYKLNIADPSCTNSNTTSFSSSTFCITVS